MTFTFTLFSLQHFYNFENFYFNVYSRSFSFFSRRFCPTHLICHALRNGNLCSRWSLWEPLAKLEPTPCQYSPSRAGWLCCVQVHPLWLPGGGDPLPDPEGPGEPKCTTGCPQGTGAAQPRTSTEAAGAGPEGIPPLAPPGVTWSIKFLSCCPGSCLAPKPTLWGRAHFDLSQPKFGGSVAQEGSLDDPRAQRGH